MLRCGKFQLNCNNQPTNGTGFYDFSVLVQPDRAVVGIRAIVKDKQPGQIDWLMGWVVVARCHVHFIT